MTLPLNKKGELVKAFSNGLPFLQFLSQILWKSETITISLKGKLVVDAIF